MQEPQETTVGSSTRNRLWTLLRLFAVVGVLALLGLLVYSVERGKAGAKYVNQIRSAARPTAPPFTGDVIWPVAGTWPQQLRPALADGRVSLSELRGTPVVMNFWASWCEACKAEARVLSAAAARYSGRVAFVGLDVQDLVSAAKRYLRHFDTNYVSLRFKGNAEYERYGLTGLPETYLIDAHGRTIVHLIGATKADALDAAIGDLLKESGRRSG